LLLNLIVLLHISVAKERIVNAVLLALANLSAVILLFYSCILNAVSSGTLANWLKKDAYH